MSFPIKYTKGSSARVGRHFKAHEFDCPCTHCEGTSIDPELVKLLDKLRDALRSPIQITSAYRCDWYQSDLKRRGYETAKGLSTHQMGQAADLLSGSLTGAELEAAARKVGFRAVGVGKKFVHVDMRSDKDRRWKYTY